MNRATPLPSGRAVVGALLITVAAVGVFGAYRSASDGPSQSIVIAANELPIGHRLTTADLRVQAGELPESAKAAGFDSVTAVVGAVTVAPLHAGDIVQRSAVLARSSGADDAGTLELSFAVERERALDGALQRGERVDVLATYGTGDAAFTNVVSRDVTVVDIDTGPKSGAIGSTSKITFTVALTDGEEVLRLAHATQVAPITLVRTSRTEGREAGDLDTVHSPTVSTANSRNGSAGGTTSSTQSTGSQATGNQRGG